MSSKLNFEYDVRIPKALVQQMLDGEITCAMLITMTILYNWADWNTGRVRRASSGGLWTASHKAYSDRTFRISLQKLEEMGWITRHMVPGSHKDYPVTIHNYKVVDDAGKVHILNPKDIKVSDPYETAGCHEHSRESSQEASHDGSQETSQEGSQKYLSNLLLDTESNPEPQNESQPLSNGKESVSHSFSPSRDAGASRDLSEEQDKNSPAITLKDDPVNEELTERIQAADESALYRGALRQTMPEVEAPFPLEITLQSSSRATKVCSGTHLIENLKKQRRQRI